MKLTTFCVLKIATVVTFCVLNLATFATLKKTLKLANPMDVCLVYSVVHFVFGHNDEL